MDKEKSCLECYWCNTAGCVHREYTGEICVDKRYWKMKEKRTCESGEAKTKLCINCGNYGKCSSELDRECRKTYFGNWQPKSQSLDKTGQGEKESFEESYEASIEKELQVFHNFLNFYGIIPTLPCKIHLIREEAISAYKKSLVEKIEKAICDCEDGNCKDCAVKEIINLIEEVEK